MIRGDGPDEERAEIIEVSGAGRPLGPIGRRSNRPIAAAAGLVIVLALVAFIGVAYRDPRPVGLPTAPASSAPAPAGALAPTLTVAGSATPLGSEFPAEIDSLAVHSVSEALPSGPGPAGVIAVGGYLSNDRAPEGCPPAATTGKPNPCSGTQLVLIDQPDMVLQPNDATFLYDIVVPPGLASIEPEILPGTTVPDPWAPLSGLKAMQLPRPVVLVGQFGDRRSAQCAPRPGGGNAGCDRSFVVDQIAWLDGLSQGPSIWQGSGRTPVHTWQDTAAAVAGWFLPALQPEIVSITSTLPADSQALTGVSLDGRSNELYWVVRVIGAPTGGPATSTFLVFDDRTLNLVEVSAAD